MDLDRQERPRRLDASGRPLVPSRVPETRPPLLGDWFIYLSIIVLICGVVAITALELGAPITDAVVRIPVLLAGVLLVLLSVDAMFRVWRSAWAWLPIDRGRGLFRFVWAATLAAILVLTVVAIAFVLQA
ncbi:MAG TPA: hypothetical protein VK992_02570 [Candidatus Caenarcaniphilales bacterium]|nr:hypothetical protein [Candidatus Caenarcaniphilales bacterium]